MFNATDVEAPGVASFEAIENFARFLDLSSLIVKNAERGIAAGPFGHQLDGVLEPLGGLFGVALQDRDQALAPDDLSGAWDSRQAFLQRLLRGGNIVVAKLN